MQDVIPEQLPPEDEANRQAALAKARAAFDLVQRIRMFGVFRCNRDITDFLGLSPGSLGVDRLQQLERKVQRTDISRGASYTQKGLIYGCTIGENELGYWVGYAFIAKA